MSPRSYWAAHITMDNPKNRYYLERRDQIKLWELLELEDIDPPIGDLHRWYHQLTAKPSPAPSPRRSREITKTTRVAVRSSSRSKKPTAKKKAEEEMKEEKRIEKEQRRKELDDARAARATAAAEGARAEAEAALAAAEALRLNAERIEREAAPPRDAIFRVRFFPHNVAGDRVAAHRMAQGLGILLDSAGDENQVAYWQELKKVRHLLLEKLPSGDYKHKTVIDAAFSNLLPDWASFHASHGGARDDATVRREFELQYAQRRFEIDEMTMSAQQCGCCSFAAPTPGVFSRASGTEGAFHDCKNKSVYRVADTSSPCGFSYRYESKKNAAGPRGGDRTQTPWTSGGWELVESVCHNCYNDLKGGRGGSKQPKFSAPSGFNHGVAVPPCLQGLSYVEEALISPIQAAMAARTLKQGMRSVKASTVHVAQLFLLSFFSCNL